MERPQIKDKSALAYVEYLESQLKLYTESSLLGSYLSIKSLVDAGNEQIKQKSKEIDIFTPEGQKAHQSISKFTSQLKAYEEQMEYFRGKMNPAQQRALREQEKMDKLGLAEKMAINGRG